jgi:hypothetical protein
VPYRALLGLCSLLPAMPSGRLEATDTFSAVAGIASIVGLLGTAVGLVAFLFERRSRQNLEREHQVLVWSNISKITGLMSDLEKDAAMSTEPVGTARCPGTLQAIGKLTFMLRDSLREAVLAEKDFSLETIANWRTVGKLASDWQERLARTLLTSNQLGVGAAASNAFRNWDALEQDHPAFPGGIPRERQPAPADPKRDSVASADSDGDSSEIQ